MVLYFAFSAAPFIILILGFASLPALIDIGVGATSNLRISDTEIAWRSGRRGGVIPRPQVKLVRLDTRLDFSLRVTLLTHQGQKTRLPYECVPAFKDLEAALLDRDISFEQHHFTLLS